MIVEELGFDLPLAKCSLNRFNQHGETPCRSPKPKGEPQARPLGQCRPVVAIAWSSMVSFRSASRVDGPIGLLQQVVILTDRVTRWPLRDTPHPIQMKAIVIVEC
jgi:hypothetical protein